jgi:CopG family nickel-responsive transcriptional regulator
MHAHLDHENCFETTFLRGPTAAVKAFAEALMAERGVRHGKLNLVSVEVEQRHAHGYKPRGHGARGAHGGQHHVHLKPSR